ncbi:hypothetical protein EVAR_63184_1 [Eumeta japonica]|uniref:Uncharacterized protein n=1 Tax=Eumeta variegata TaxID=151549 RepID=A0A4C2A0V6_EUMVA|nr:hypothetical protein EVAR_63184_1 [Eumeta japonica]
MKTDHSIGEIPHCHRTEMLSSCCYVSTSEKAPVPHFPSMHPAPFPPSSHFPFMKYPIPTQGTGNALVTPLRLKVSMGRCDYLLFRSSRVLYLFEHAINDKAVGHCSDLDEAIA